MVIASGTENNNIVSLRHSPRHFPEGSLVYHIYYMISQLKCMLIFHILFWSVFSFFHDIIPVRTGCTYMTPLHSKKLMDILKIEEQWPKSGTPDRPIAVIGYPLNTQSRNDSGRHLIGRNHTASERNRMSVHRVHPIMAEQVLEMYPTRIQATRL